MKGFYNISPEFSGEEDDNDFLSHDVNALRNEITQLKRQLKRLQFQNSSEGITVSDIIQTLISSSSDHYNLDLVSQLRNAQNETDVSKVIHIFQNFFQQDSTSSISRLCKQLQGHVNFLIRLAEAPELQSLFLISQNSGNIFLSETVRHLLLEQASRTTEFLTSYSENQYDDIQSIIPQIEEQLGTTFDAKKRLDDICEFIQTGNVKGAELNTMLWQEFVIVDVLRRFIEKLIQKNEQLLKSKSSINSAKMEQELRKKIKHELKAKLTTKIEARLRATLRSEIEAEIRDELTQQIEDQLYPKVERELTPQIEKKLTEKVRKDVKSELRPKIESEVRQTLKPIIREELIDEVKDEVKDEITPILTKQIKKSLKSEIEDKLRPQLTEEIRLQLRDEVIDDVKSEVTSELKPKLTKKIESELRPKIEEELEEASDHRSKTRSVQE